jgi:glycosyltransferase involved in cell wall biosynthesis
MRFCFDAQVAVDQRAGIGRYARCLAAALASVVHPDELELFWFDSRRRPAPASLAGIRARVHRWVPRRLVQACWKAAGWPPFDWFAGRADVYHFPNFVRPPLASGRSVVTVHDLAFLRYPGTGERRNVRWLTSRIGDTVLRADAVIAVSEFGAREMEELLGVSRERLHAIPNGVSIRRPAPDDVVATRRRLGLDAPYLLHVGTLEPRKNIPFLVDVFERLERFDGDLVIAGQHGWKDGPILRRIVGSRRAHRIRHLDFVGEEDLPSLYAGAETFVFPTLYEGFGLPALEAMACGTPVVAAGVASLPEVVGDAGILVDGYDADEWAARVARVLDDAELCDRLRRAGPARAAELTWGKAAQRTLDVYRKVVS